MTQPHTYQPNAQAARQMPATQEPASYVSDLPLRRGKEPVTRSASIVAMALDDTSSLPFGSTLSHEPKMFPGVVSRRRRSSVSRLSGGLGSSANLAASAEQDGETALGVKSSTGNLRRERDRDGDGLVMGGGNNVLERKDTIDEAVSE